MSKLQDKIRERNEERADTAEAALLAFVNETGQEQEMAHGEADCVINDLICNLQHYCRQHDLDWDACLRVGTDHFNCEDPEHPDDIETGDAAHAVELDEKGGAA